MKKKHILSIICVGIGIVLLMMVLLWVKYVRFFLDHRSEITIACTAAIILVMSIYCNYSCNRTDHRIDDIIEDMQSKASLQNNTQSQSNNE